MQLADAQERHAELDDGVIAAERKLAEAREQLRTLERRAQEARSTQRWPRAAASCSAHRDRAQQIAKVASAASLQTSWTASTTPPPRPACRTRWRSSRARAGAGRRAQRIRRPDAALRKADEQRWASSAAWSAARAHHQAAARRAGRALGGSSTASSSPPRSTWRRWPVHRGGGVKLYGLQGEIDRINREIAALGAVNLAALDELTAARERKTFLDAQSPT
jgi:chromosome segregation protein